MQNSAELIKTSQDSNVKPGRHHCDHQPITAQTYNWCRHRQSATLCHSGTNTDKDKTDALNAFKGPLRDKAGKDSSKIQRKVLDSGTEMQL